MSDISKAKLGIAQWFDFEQYEFVESCMRDFNELGVTDLRTFFSWQDWERDGGLAWFDYLAEQFRNHGIEVLPCLTYTPESKAREYAGRKLNSYPPRKIEDYVEFVQQVIRRYGDCFQWIQIWNEPNWKVYWDWDLDPDWKIYAQMAKLAAGEIHAAGKKTVLGGMTPLELQWLAKMREHGMMESIDAVALHQSSGSWLDRRRWFGWKSELEALRAMLKGFGAQCEIWVTETGYSTYGEGKEKSNRERKQIEYWESIQKLPVDKIYWYSLVDQHKEIPTDDAINLGVEASIIAYHFGIRDRFGNPKPLYFHWKERMHKK